MYDVHSFQISLQYVKACGRNRKTDRLTDRWNAKCSSQNKDVGPNTFEKLTIPIHSKQFLPLSLLLYFLLSHGDGLKKKRNTLNSKISLFQT